MSATKRKKYSKEFKEQMRALYCLAGKSLQEIAEMNSIPYNTIVKWSSEGNWSEWAKAHDKERSEALLNYCIEQRERYKDVANILDDLVKQHKAGNNILTIDNIKKVVEAYRIIDEQTVTHLIGKD